MELLSNLKSFCSKNTLSPIEIVYFLLLGSLFFSFKIVLDQDSNFILGQYSDFTSISFWFPLDILVLTAMVWRFFQTKLSNKVYIGLTIGLLLVFTWAALADGSFIFSLYSGLRFYIAILLGFLVVSSKNLLNLDKFLFITVVIGLAQSVIAIGQFYLQSSIGLSLLGESSLQINSFGVAKVVTHGTIFLRSYGTLPHPNILGAALAIISILNLYLLNKTRQFHVKLFLYGSFTLISAGLWLTFSRGAILISGLAIILFLVQQIIAHKAVPVRVIAIVIVSWGTLILLLYPFFTEKITTTDQSFIERAIYLDSGSKMVKSSPFIGLGPGQNVFHMQQFSEITLKPWEIQPTHNVYVAMISEWGIVAWFGLGAILYSIYLLFRKYFKNLYQNFGKDRMNWLIVLCSLSLIIILAFSFDHYFYTIWPMQVILWLIIGLFYREARILQDQTDVLHEKQKEN